MCLSPLALGVLFTALIKAEMCIAFTVKLEINTLFTPKTTNSLEMLMILSAARSLQYPLSHPFRLKLGEYNAGNVLVLQHQRSGNCSYHCKVDFSSFQYSCVSEYCHPKDYITAAINNIFVRDLIRDNKTVAWFIMYQFLNMHTVLTFIRGVIVYSDFCLAISVFFPQKTAALITFTGEILYGKLNFLCCGFIWSHS